MATFTPAGSGGAVSTVSIQASTTPTIANVAMASAGTEYSYTLPTNTRQFMIKLRDYLADLQLAYISGESGTTYITVPRGTFLAVGNLSLTSSITLYFQATAAAQVAEIQSWL